MKVSFIGSGNLSWHLGPALDNAGYIVKEVYSPNPKHAGALTERLYQAEVKATLDFSTSHSEIFIIAVTDDAIESVATEIILPEEAVLLHTSGSASLDLIQCAATPHIGVFYPLQTFIKHKRIDFRAVPVFVESRTPDAEKKILAMAKAVSNQVKKITSEERKALFVASVFASNFANHMLTMSKEILQKNSLGFDLLKPLIQEMVLKSLSAGPETAQSGPAMQGDLKTLDEHIEFLKDDEALAEMYRLINQHILDRYHAD